MLLAYNATSVALIVSFCSTGKAGRQLNLHRGIFPVISEETTPVAALKEAEAMGFVSTGDSVILVSEGSCTIESVP